MPFMGKLHAYDTDIVAWAEEQAALLRGLAQDKNLSNAIDWDNVVEEIETVGRTETRVVTSAIRLVFVHLMKLAVLPNSPSANHWQAEIVVWLGDIRADFTPSMAQKINLQVFWQRALREVTILLSDNPEARVSNINEFCPFALNELLDETFGPAEANRALKPASQ